MPELVVLRSTYASEKDANEAGHLLVEKRLVACAQISSCQSIYRWKGKIASATEWQLDVKVPAGGVDGAWEMMLDRHPYEVPCVELVGSVQVPAPYARWAGRVTQT